MLGVPRTVFHVFTLGNSQLCQSKSHLGLWTWRACSAKKAVFRTPQLEDPVCPSMSPTFCMKPEILSSGCPGQDRDVSNPTSHLKVIEARDPERRRTPAITHVGFMEHSCVLTPSPVRARPTTSFFSAHARHRGVAAPIRVHPCCTQTWRRIPHISLFFCSAAQPCHCELLLSCFGSRIG